MIEQTDLDALVKNARNCLRAGKGAEAIQLLQQAIDADADCLAAHETLAAAYFRSEQFDKAIEHYQVASRLDPRQLRSDINIGAIHNRLGNYDEAVKALRRGIGKDRKCADGYYNLGLAYRGLNQQSMAVSAYREAIRLRPEMSEAHLNLGNVFVDMGNYQQAILHYKTALEIRPGFERAERGLIHAEKARERAQQQIGPFGRLVTPEQLAGAVNEAATRELTDDERLEDRHTLRQLSVDVTADSAQLLECLKKELEPSLLSLARAVAQGDDSTALLANSLPAFQEALLHFRDCRTTQKNKLDQMRAHEEFIGEEESNATG